MLFIRHGPYSNYDRKAAEFSNSFLNSCNSAIIDIRDVYSLAIMTKSARTHEGSTNSEVRELHEMMQKVLSELGTLMGEVSSFTKLDQVVLEMMKQLATAGGSRGDKSPVNSDGRRRISRCIVAI
ncbi:hypothetical protein HAX54_035167 [Datura stramonium]|uniref:Uncharacterized protein n=1 Tax=Datura stramonium TaxID=4076 RepID=A0ABS8VG28_DATST|nr:hypothetical protein [Datura stramonium]